MIWQSVKFKMFKSTHKWTEAHETWTMLYPLPQIIVAVWHSYARTLLMPCRLVILWISALICDKLPHFVLFILHDLLSLTAHWFSVLMSPMVRFWGNYPSNSPGGFNIHFSHDIHLYSVMYTQLPTKWGIAQVCSSKLIFCHIRKSGPSGCDKKRPMCTP